MKTISYTTSATRQLRKLPADIRERLIEKLHRYVETGAGDVKALTGHPAARLRLAIIASYLPRRQMRFQFVPSGIGGISMNERTSM